MLVTICCSFYRDVPVVLPSNGTTRGVDVCVAVSVGELVTVRYEGMRVDLWLPVSVESLMCARHR